MPKAEEFEILCGCGQTLDGKRRALYQRVLCKECGESIFVLPLNVYPTTATPSGRKSKRRKKRSQGDESEQRPNLVSLLVGGAVQRGKSGIEASKSATVGAARKVLTPFRLVLIVILLAISATGYSVWHRGMVEEARETLRAAMVDAQAALDSGNFYDAARHYAVAAEALDRIGRDDAESRTIRQLSRETEAVRHLADGSFFDMLTAAERAETPEDWAEDFKVAYRDKWLIFMPADVVRSAGRERNFDYSVDCPVLVGTRSVRFDGALTIFEQLDFKQDEAEDDVPVDPRRSVVFAAQVVDCRLSIDETESWVVTLRPESAFLWSTFDILSKIEGPGDDESADTQLQELLDEQTAAISGQFGEIEQ